MRDFRITLADKAVCNGCTNEFMESEDCRLCAIDAEAKHYQHEWWHAPHLVFMGVNIGQALSHAARGYVLMHLRLQGEKDEEAASRVAD